MGTSLAARPPGASGEPGCSSSSLAGGYAPTRRSGSPMKKASVAGHTGFWGNRDWARCCLFYGVLIAVNDAVTAVPLVGVKVKVQVLEEPDVAEKVPTTVAA